MYICMSIDLFKIGTEKTGKCWFSIKIHLRKGKLYPSYCLFCKIVSTLRSLRFLYVQSNHKYTIV